jgi:hypothetical protein
MEDADADAIVLQCFDGHGNDPALPIKGILQAVGGELIQDQAQRHCKLRDTTHLVSA